MPGRCPLGRGWCVEREVDSDGTHLCEGEGVALPSGWSVTLRAADGETTVVLSDPSEALDWTLTGRLNPTDACDLLAALAAAIRDAQATSSSPLAASA